MQLAGTLRRWWLKLPNTIRATVYTCGMLGGQWIMVPNLVRRGEQTGRPGRIQRFMGLLIASSSLGWTLWATAYLTRRSQGTPFPFDPPRVLVSTGPFRFTRNPMMLGVVGVVAGDAMRRGSRRQGVYTLGLYLVYTLLVHFEEEPWLDRHFGAHWHSYAAVVPRWIGRGSTTAKTARLHRTES